MNTPPTAHPVRPAFTLIELLVVIAIIAVLAAMGYGVATSAIIRAKKISDRVAITALARAIDQFHDEYGRLPELGGSGSGADTTTESDSGLMNILQGVGETGKAQNPKLYRFYKGRRARGTSSATASNGLFYSGTSSVELFDVWRKSGSVKRHYQVILDTNYDGEIAHPFKGGETFYDHRVLVWSTGPDGRQVLGVANDSKNRDNVYLWE